jgi:transcriptional regulator with XRE-family HTH domain
MSLKTSFASVIKAMRATRGLSQKNLAEVSSRTYISKLERGQCSPTLEMITALSAPLNLSPLTLVALAIGTESGQPIRSLVSRLEVELSELAEVGTLSQLQPAPYEAPSPNQRPRRPRTKHPASFSQQAEFCFAD